jgi:hypothetical protein
LIYGETPERETHRIASLKSGKREAILYGTIRLLGDSIGRREKLAEKTLAVCVDFSKRKGYNTNRSSANL